MGENLGQMIWRKLGEPSTWQGVGQLAISVGLATAPQVNAIVAAGMALWGVVNVIRRERKPA